MDFQDEDNETIPKKTMLPARNPAYHLRQVYKNLAILCCCLCDSATHFVRSPTLFDESCLLLWSRLFYLHLFVIPNLYLIGYQRVVLAKRISFQCLLPCTAFSRSMLAMSRPTRRKCCADFSCNPGPTTRSPAACFRPGAQGRAVVVSDSAAGARPAIRLAAWRGRGDVAFNGVRTRRFGNDAPRA